MPLFFFLAGWTQKNKTVNGFKEWKEFLLKKIVALLVPYFLYSLIACNGQEIVNLKYISYGSIFSLNHIGAIGTIWFLPCMFVSVIIYQIIVNITNGIKNKPIKFTILVGILLVCGIISSYFNFYKVPQMGVPFSCNIALSGVIFMFIGKGIAILYSKIINDLKKLQNKKYILIITILLLASGIILHKLNTKAFLFDKYNFGIVMAEAWYGNYFIFIVNATICSLGIVFLSVVIDNKFLAYFGKNTLTILYFHILALRITKTYITNQLSEGTYKCFIDAIIAFLQMGIVIPIINKFFPNLAGKYASQNHRKEERKDEKNNELYKINEDTTLY